MSQPERKTRNIMDHRRYIPVFFIAGLLLVFLISGCALRTGYGKFRLQPRDGVEVTVQYLLENWKDYTVYYAGSSIGNPGGIMFDPKGDNRTLTGDTWIKVEDRRTLSELIGWMKTYHEYNPQIWRILGPDDELYGYLYYPRTHRQLAVTKVVDETTMYVYDLLSPRRLDSWF